MRTFASLALCLLSAGLLSSCHLKESYSKNQSARATFLEESKTAPAKINVEGLYYSPEWGVVVLKQTSGGKVSGLMGDYGVVEGVVSGRKVFLAIVDSGWTDYTLVLERPAYDQLVGAYSDYVPFNDKSNKKVVLEKIRL